MDDEIWHPRDSNHAIHCKRKDRSSSGGRSARTYAARHCFTIHGNRKPALISKENIMSKFTVFGLICVIALGACSALPAPTNSVPTVDIAGTVNSIAQTS